MPHPQKRQGTDQCKTHGTGEWEGEVTGLGQGRVHRQM